MLDIWLPTINLVKFVPNIWKLPKTAHLGCHECQLLASWNFTSCDNIVEIPVVGNTDSETIVSFVELTFHSCFIRCDDYFVEVNATLDDFAGYIQTWSGFQKFKATEGNEKAEQVIKDFLQQ